MRIAAALIAIAMVGACSGADGEEGAAEGQGNLLPPLDLESAALERGVIRDPASTEIAGLYERDTDRVCIVENGIGYRIGAFVDYGDRTTCSATGNVSRVGEVLRIEFTGKDDCSFEARFDGDAIRFPGQMPAGCATYCASRASFVGLDVDRLSESQAEAAALRDDRGKPLCPAD